MAGVHVSCYNTHALEGIALPLRGRKGFDGGVEVG